MRGLGRLSPALRSDLGDRVLRVALSARRGATAQPHGGVYTGDLPHEAHGVTLERTPHGTERMTNAHKGSRKGMGDGWLCERLHAAQVRSRLCVSQSLSHHHRHSRDTAHGAPVAQSNRVRTRGQPAGCGTGHGARQHHTRRKHTRQQHNTLGSAVRGAGHKGVPLEACMRVLGSLPGWLAARVMERAQPPRRRVNCRQRRPAAGAQQCKKISEEGGEALAAARRGGASRQAGAAAAAALAGRPARPHGGAAQRSQGRHRAPEGATPLA